MKEKGKDGYYWFVVSMVIICATLSICLYINLRVYRREKQHEVKMLEMAQLLKNSNTIDSSRKSIQTNNLILTENIETTIQEAKAQRDKVRDRIKKLKKELFERSDDLYKVEQEARDIMGKVIEWEKKEKNDPVRQNFLKVLRQLEQLVTEWEEIQKEKNIVLQETLIAKELLQNKRSRRDITKSAETDAYLNSLQYTFEPDATWVYCTLQEDIDYDSDKNE